LSASRAAGAATARYGRRARVLSLGIGLTGIVTFAYFAVARHVLDDSAYGRISVLWSVMFVIVTVIYRPIEQLLSRSIAERRARGGRAHSLRVAATIQFGFAAVFLAVALPLRRTVTEDVFRGSDELYWVLVAGVLCYGASYFARGWLAGHQRVALYGGLVLLESCSRFLFALAVAVGIAEGQSVVALGMAAAPLVSLVVLPWAFARGTREGAAETALVQELDAALQGPAAEGVEEQATDLTLRRGTGFAASVFLIMLAEQTLLNASVLTVRATATEALAGVVFNALLIARAPLQLFQAIQTSLLPHLAELEVRAGAAEFRHAVRVTLLAIAGFASAAALVLLGIGPFVMDVLFNHSFDYPRGGLALVALGMGFHLAAGTLNQAALARDRAGLAAFAWLLAAALFVGWMVTPAISDQLLRAEVGYAGAAGILSGLLLGLYRRPAAAATASASAA